jgi:thiamine biosynthesis lipoprotein
MKLDKLSPVLYLLLAGMVSINACDRQTIHDKVLEINGITMGTTFTVKVADADAEAGREILAADIEAILLDINDSMSTYIEDSELSRLNRNESADWIAISAELTELLQLALDVSSLTEGAFDITVGPLVNLWGFGPDQVSESIPAVDVVMREAAKTGYKLIQLDKDGNRIKKARPDMYIDLSAIAKGYAVDRIAAYLAGKSLRRYMVEIGGEIRASGTNSKGINWRIGIEKPDSSQRSVQRIIGLSDTAMATSGDYRNYYIRAGKRYSHTIDPRTGYPVSHKLASVTVLHQSTALADALATGLLVMGTERAYALAEQQNIAAFFLTGTDTGFEERYTPEFESFLADAEPEP